MIFLIGRRVGGRFRAATAATNLQGFRRRLLRRSSYRSDRFGGDQRLSAVGGGGSVGSADGRRRQNGRVGPVVYSVAGGSGASRSAPESCGRRRRASVADDGVSSAAAERLGRERIGLGSGRKKGRRKDG